MTAARLLTETGKAVPASLETRLTSAPRPRIGNPADAREPLWAILAQPHRARGLAWLDEQGLLEEILPCWAGNPVRRKLRLDAVEQVHLEVWKNGLSEPVFNMICDTHDVVVDQRLNRWALTALATLLAGGDVEDPRTQMSFVRRDLYALGATEAEIVWVTGIVLNFNAATMMLRGEQVNLTLRPEYAVACLSALSLTEPDLLEEATLRANAELADAVNPLDRIAEDDD